MSDVEKIKTVKVPAAPSRDSAYAALNGVTVDWLRRAFHLSTQTTDKKLQGARVIGVTDRGVPLYDLADAAARLIQPKLNLRELLKSVKPDELPDNLREPFWNAKLKQQRYEKNAGELWRTEAVIQLFGSVLKDTKERIRMVTTLAESNLGLTTTQMEKLREIVNSVQGGIHEHIQQLESKTPASIAELNREFDEDVADYDSPTTPIKSRDDYEY